MGLGMAGMGDLFKSNLAVGRVVGKRAELLAPIVVPVLASAGAVDRAMLTLAGLLVMAGLQLVRGQVLAPAATLRWHAVATRHFLTPPDRGE